MSKKSSANFKFKPTNFVNLFKITGLVMLSLFTFYFIYNYLTTGSFDLRPSASEVSCASRITSTTCTDGCVWTPPKYKSVTVDCSDNDCKSGEGGCKFVNKTTTTYTYQCEEPGLTAQKCQSLGFAWQKIPKTTTTRVCEGTRSDLTEISAGICSGTPNRPPPVVIVNPTPGTCSLGNTQCSADGKSLQVCTGNGVWTTNPCPSGSVCSMGKCTASAPPKCTDVCDKSGIRNQTTKYAIGCTDLSNKTVRCCPKNSTGYNPITNECLLETTNSGKNVPGNAIPAKTNGTETYFNSDVESLCKKQYPEYSYHRNGWVLRTGKSWWSYIFTIIDNNNDPSHPLPTCEAGHVVVGNVYSSKDNKHSKRWGICCQTPETLLKVNQSKCGNFVFTKKSDGKDYSIPLSCQLGKNIKCLDSYVINDLPKVVGDIVFRDPNITKNAKSCTTSSNEIGGFCCP